MPEPPPEYGQQPSESGDGSVARLIAIILSAGIAWATAVTVAAWILGRLLARG